MTDSDNDTTELEIESKTFHKIKARMKILGYQEGVAKGRENLLQEGFNLGYVDGFNLGLHLGKTRAKIRFKGEICNSEKDKYKDVEMKLDNITKEICKMCQRKRGEQDFDDNPSSFEKVTLDQQNHNNQIIMILENSNVWELT